MNVTLYHGTIHQFVEADLSRANSARDFGKGFYTTTSLEQATRFVRILVNRNKISKGYVNKYVFSQNESLAVKRFESANIEWLEFVLYNRSFQNANSVANSYDIIIGPVANDSVGETLNLLVTGAYGDPQSETAKNIALSLLLPERLTNQWVFSSQRAIDYLEFQGSDEYEF